MSQYHRRSPSPLLPTFGIRNLFGPSTSPGLIAITRSQYTDTLKSQPDAALLYLDDDDGEVITIGSSLELAQRLDEPVATRIGEVESSSSAQPDDSLMHIFDIRHSSGVLAEWRDHEAYSSKTIRQRQSETNSPQSFDSTEEPAVMPVVVAKEPDSTLPLPDKTPVPATTGTPIVLESFKSPRVDIVEGIETHLNGLATVLQVAADALRRAAEKTRETDTSLVEDVLAGVKGILTEVGSLGVEVYNEVVKEQTQDDVAPVEDDQDVLEDDAFEEAVEEAIFTGFEDVVAQTIQDDVDMASNNAESQSISSIEDLSARNKVTDSDNESINGDIKWWLREDQFHRCGCGCTFPSRMAYKSHVSSRVSPNCTSCDEIKGCSSDKSPDLDELLRGSQLSDDVDGSVSSKRSSKVKFALGTQTDGQASSATHHVVHTDPVPTNTTNLSQSYFWPSSNVAGPSQLAAQRDRHVDGRFDARPTTQSILDEPSEDPDFTARYPPLRSIRRAKSTIEPRNAQSYSDAPPIRRSSFSRPAGYLPPLDFTAASSHQRGTDRNNDMYESSRKPLPGAWPDVKAENDTTAESSGAFFNRMTGRNTTTTLHRANTTASSNPASRLTGPFDPGFPYQVTNQNPTQRWSTRSLRAPPRLSLGPLNASFPSRPDAPVAPRYDTRPSIGGSSATVQPQPYRRDFRPTQPFVHDNLRHARSVPQLKPAFMSSNNLVPPRPVPAPGRRPFLDFSQAGVQARPVSLSIPPTPPSIVSVRQLHEEPSPRVPGGFETPARASDRDTVENYPGIGAKSKFDDCVEFLKLCGFGIEDDNLRDRLHVYAVAADGDVETAVEMIEEDRQVSKGLD